MNNMLISRHGRELVNWFFHPLFCASDCSFGCYVQNHNVMRLRSSSAFYRRFDDGVPAYACPMHAHVACGSGDNFIYDPTRGQSSIAYRRSAFEKFTIHLLSLE